MKKSVQDDYYLNTEGDNFFKRNYEGKAVPKLRPNKQTILTQLNDLQIRATAVLEYGCNYGDLLHELSKNGAECIGVEASSKASELGNSIYPETIRIHKGTIANNPINADEKNDHRFDLIIVEDVFGWVSRETLFRSITNIDNALKEGGYLFIRDFFPAERVRNKNHHVSEDIVFNYKVPGSHAQIFIDSGIYAIHHQRTFIDHTDMSANYRSSRLFESRWTDVILKKSYKDYFNINKPVEQVNVV